MSRLSIATRGFRGSTNFRLSVATHGFRGLSGIRKIYESIIDSLGMIDVFSSSAKLNASVLEELTLRELLNLNTPYDITDIARFKAIINRVIKFTAER